MKFVDVKNDVAFRKIFGNEQKTVILISFLNSVLKLEGDRRIAHISFINPYLLPRIVGEKASVIDIRARDEKGQQFVIEMQMADVNGFAKRVQYYTCRDYSSQIQRGQGYGLLKPTYFIGILDFNFFQSPGYLSQHIILDGETYEHKLTDIQFTFIELPKFTKELAEIDTLVENWVYFIKHAENLDLIPDNVEDEGLLEAYKDAEMHRWTRDELIEYDNSFIAMQDAIGRIEFAEQKGMELGMQKGIEKGVQEEKQQVVLRCWSAKMSVADIAIVAGVKEEEVLAIIARWSGETDDK